MRQGVSIWTSITRLIALDHMIKKTDTIYPCWECWHAPMRHAKVMAVVVAYDMYLEVAEGQLKMRSGDCVSQWTSGGSRRN